MYWKAMFDRFLDSDGFLKEQFALEKLVIDKIQQKCLQEKNSEDFEMCKSELKNQQKVYKNTVLLLESQFQEKITKEMMENCLKINDSEAFLSCMSKTSQGYSEKFEDLKKTIIFLRRCLIEEIIQR